MARHAPSPPRTSTPGSGPTPSPPEPRWMTATRRGSPSSMSHAVAPRRTTTRVAAVPCPTEARNVSAFTFLSIAVFRSRPFASLIEASSYGVLRDGLIAHDGVEEVQHRANIRRDAAQRPLGEPHLREMPRHDRLPRRALVCQLPLGLFDEQRRLRDVGHVFGQPPRLQQPHVLW